MGRHNVYFPIRKEVNLLVSFLATRVCDPWALCVKTPEAAQEDLAFVSAWPAEENVRSGACEPTRCGCAHLNSALNFELIPRVEAFGCLWITNVYALLRARLHNELGDVVLFVEQELRGSVGHDVVDEQAVG